MSVDQTKPSAIEAILTREIDHFHAMQLREPALAAYFKHFRDRVAVDERYQLMLTYMDAFLKEAEVPEEEQAARAFNAIRRLGPLLATAFTIPEERAHLKFALEQAAQSQSDRIKEELKSGNMHVNVLNVGAGLHSAIFASRIRATRPDASILSVTRSNFLGGQFAEYDGAVIYMNTAVLPFIQGIDGVNANPLGADAPVEMNAVINHLYGDSEAAGMVGDLDQYLSALSAMELDVVKVARNDPAKTGMQGQYVTTMEDTITHETFPIYSDIVFYAPGLGDEVWGIEELATDQESQRVLRIQQARGENSRLQSYQQFLREVGDTTNPLPLQKYIKHSMLIAGGADSQRTVAEEVLLSGPDERQQVAALGHPLSITVVGGPNGTLEEFRQNVAPRYKDLEPFMGTPKSLIQLIKHGRIVRIAQPGSQGKETDEEALNSPLQIFVRLENGKIEMRETDFAIFTTGFTEDRMRTIFADFLPDQTDTRVPDCFQVVCDGEGREIGRTVDRDGGILVGGPCAKVSKPEERVQATATGVGSPTNPVAIFNTELPTVCAADMCCQQLGQIPYKPSNLSISLPEPIQLPQITTDETFTDSMTVLQPVAVRSLPENIDDQRLVAERVTAFLTGFAIPDGTTIELRFDRNGRWDPNPQYTVSSNQPEFGLLFAQIIADPWIQHIVAARTSRNGFPSCTITIPIPFNFQHQIIIE